MDWVTVPRGDDEAGSGPAILSIGKGEDRGPLHVFDLPQLHIKPSAALLLSTLSQLALGVSSWDVDPTESRKSPLIDQDGVPSYLTRIISSPLHWIENDEEKEEIWEAASKRLSERSGRSAMPSLSRTFKIPVAMSNGRECYWGDERQINVQLYEPSLTGDNLGNKTWIASYLLAKRLPILFPRHFPSIKAFSAQRRGLSQSEDSKTRDQSLVHQPGNPNAHSALSNDPRPKILELGAGTGLVGLAASGLFSVDIHLTDLAPILPNLEHNIRQNEAIARFSGSFVTAGKLDWSESLALLREEEKYEVIFAADSLYAAEHSGWLVSTMADYLRKGPESRVFVELPLRFDSSYPGEFGMKMEDAGFGLLEEGEEVGYDDWQTSLHQRLEVTCWWSVWEWASSTRLQS